MRLPPEGPVRPEPGACPMLETQADAFLGWVQQHGVTVLSGVEKGQWARGRLAWQAFWFCVR